MADIDQADVPSPPSAASSDKAGTIQRIRVENFMCHSSLTIDLIEHVNFITGQNGSGKSAILTALCVAFGVKARSTQRATSLKSFIKTGCSHALVVVELNNEGVDAFKYSDFGKKIIIERRLTESTNTSTLKDSQGKKISMKKEELQELVEHFNIEEKRREHRDLQAQVRRLQSQQNNKVTAFGGDNVLRLLQAVERQYQKFTRPPLGPVGAHVALIGDDSWALAVEVAVGKLLNAFIVTNHKDMLVLRDCAKSCGYHHLQIIIYDHALPLLNMPPHMMPDRNLVTVKSVLHVETPTVMNVLVDQGNVERQILVKDYDEGKHVVFERKFDHVKEAFTLDGTKMYYVHLPLCEIISFC